MLSQERVGDKLRHTDVADFKFGGEKEVEKVLSLCQENGAWAKQSDRDVAEHMVQAALMKSRMAANGREVVGADEATIDKIFDVVWKRLAISDPSILRPAVEFQFKGEVFQSSSLKDKVDEVLELLADPEKRRAALAQQQGSGPPQGYGEGFPQQGGYPGGPPPQGYPGQGGYPQGQGGYPPPGYAMPMEGAQMMPDAAAGYDPNHQGGPQYYGGGGGGPGGGQGGGGHPLAPEEQAQPQRKTKQGSDEPDEDPYKHAHTLCHCRSCKEAAKAGGDVRCNVCGDDLTDKEIEKAKADEAKEHQRALKDRENEEKERQKEEEARLKAKEEYEKNMKKR